MSQKLHLIREVSNEECPWLEAAIEAGTTVYRYLGPTYGCIGAGIAVSLEKSKTPFFEVPRDAVEPAA